jgi:hypothetical protein
MERKKSKKFYKKKFFKTNKGNIQIDKKLRACAVWGIGNQE